MKGSCFSTFLNQSFGFYLTELVLRVLFNVLAFGFTYGDAQGLLLAPTLELLPVKESCLESNLDLQQAKHMLSQLSDLSSLYGLFKCFFKLFDVEFINDLYASVMDRWDF